MDIKKNGFSLLELIIAISIAGFLMLAAAPNLSHLMQMSHRNTAKLWLMDADSRIADALITQQTITSLTLPSLGLRDHDTHYQYQFIPLGPTQFTLSATPIGAQVNDPCGKLSIDASGRRAGAQQHCWD